MSISLADIVILLIFGGICGYFLGAIRVRELAIQSVRRAGQRDDFQLLDQTVHISRLSLSRDKLGRWRVWRQYRFDYSYDGVERRQGHIIMLGKQLQALIVSERTPGTLH